MRKLDDYIQNPTHKLIAEAYRKAKTPEEKEDDGKKRKKVE